MRRLERGPLLVLGLLACSLLTGCRGWPSPWPPIHINPNMDNQPKAKAQASSDFFFNGMVMREPVPGTVARGELREDTAYFTGMVTPDEYVTTSPEPQTEELLARGAERYTIYCQPCHDQRGTGQGILAEYGGVPTASFHDEQRATYPDGQLFSIITNGSGLMSSYRYPIPPRDRWAIVAYIRQLQNERRQRQAALGGSQ